MPSNASDTPTVPNDIAVRRSHVPADQRPALRATIKQSYQQGASIRTIADEIGRSYGLVYRLLEEAGVRRRPRGVKPQPTAEHRPVP